MKDVALNLISHLLLSSLQERNLLWDLGLGNEMAMVEDSFLCDW